MKINMLQTITDLTGKNLTVDGGEGSDPLTLGYICVKALTAMIDAKTPGDEKFSRYKLALRIDGKEEVDLTPEEVSKIRDLVGQAVPSVEIMGCAWEMLDSN